MARVTAAVRLLAVTSAAAIAIAGAASASNAAGAILDLGTLGGAQSFAEGYGTVNNAGQVVGYSYAIGNANTRAFRTAANGVITAGSDLGTLGGSFSQAISINASGQAVGYSATTGNAAIHAFRTAANGSITAGSDLGTLGGTQSVAYGINASGQAVGYSYTTGNAAVHAFRTAPNGAITAGSDLGTFGGTTTVAFGVNAAGQAVGYSYTAGDAAQHAFFADVTGPMIDLNTLLPAGSGWVLMQATGINDLGQISGYGTINGQTHAFLFTLPEPTTLAVLPLAGVVLRRRRGA